MMKNKPLVTPLDRVIMSVLFSIVLTIFIFNTFGNITTYNAVNGDVEAMTSDMVSVNVEYTLKYPADKFTIAEHDSIFNEISIECLDNLYTTIVNHKTYLEYKKIGTIRVKSDRMKLKVKFKHR